MTFLSEDFTSERGLKDYPGNLKGALRNQAAVFFSKEKHCH
jgi:hypothetical protein